MNMKNRRGNCYSPLSNRKLESFKDIQQDYISECLNDSIEEIMEYRKQKSFGDQLSLIGMASLNGKRQGHQRRLTHHSLQQATDLLFRNQSKIKSCKTFEELLVILDEIGHKVHGIGELYVYDTSFRIGACLGLYPKVVYLHAGTRVGARNLGLNVKRKSIPMNELPELFRKMKPHHVEDILCIYKDEMLIIAKIRRLEVNLLCIKAEADTTFRDSESKKCKDSGLICIIIN